MAANQSIFGIGSQREDIFYKFVSGNLLRVLLENKNDY